MLLRQLSRHMQATAARTTALAAVADQQQSALVLRGRTTGARWASSVVVTRDDGLPDLIITPLAAKV